MKLFDYEIEAAEVIAQEPHILLFDAMGMGKTLSVLEGLKKASEGRTGYKCVVCAPNTILGQWSDAILDWLAPYGFKCVVITGTKSQREVKYNYFLSVKDSVILVTNYTLLTKDSFYSNKSFNALVLDEGYLIRNGNTKLYSFLRSFIPGVEKVIIMSGNVESLTNRQFYNIVSLLYPNIPYGDKSYLISLLGNSYLSREFSVLPENAKIHVKPTISFIGQELSLDQDILLREIVLRENRASKIHDPNLRKILKEHNDVLNSPRIFDPSLPNSPKEKFLLDKLSELKGKTVVYCENRKFFKVIKSDLNFSKINFVVVSGEMPIYLRDRSLELFRSDPKVTCLLLSGVGKFGLNLQVANNLICMGVPKNKFVLDQLLGRLDRINQFEPVNCFIPYHINTEEAETIKLYQ